MIHVRGLTNSNKFVKLTQMFLLIRNVSIIFEKKFRDTIKLLVFLSNENYIKFRKILYSRFHSRVECPIMKKP